MISQTRLLHLSRPFVLESGATLPRPVVAYEEYGVADGPVVFIAHGGLSDHHAAGRGADGTGTPGWWDGLIGPDRAFDTARFRVIATNTLGSMYGTTGPRSRNPETGRAYGADFPAITLRDMVRFQKAFLDDLGVAHLACMAGPSMGSLQTLQMAALYPDFIDGVVAVATAGRTPPMALVAHHFIIETLRRDPQFDHGRYDPGQPLRAFETISQFAKIFYGHEGALRQATWDRIAEHPEAQRERSDGVRTFLAGGAGSRTRDWDANSLIATLSAINTHDLGRGAASFADGVRQIRCPVLLMNIDTDQEFQPQWAHEVADALNARHPGQATVEVIASAWGHIGCLKEVPQLEAAIRRFLAIHRIAPIAFHSAAATIDQGDPATPHGGANF